MFKLIKRLDVSMFLCCNMEIFLSKVSLLIDKFTIDYSLIEDFIPK